MFIGKRKILITGGDGFIGRSISSDLNRDYEVTSTNRRTLDVLSEESVDMFFNTNDVDFVIHTAAVGGRRIQENHEKYYEQNLQMYKNLAKHRDKFKLMIVFGSGAECGDYPLKSFYGRAKQDIAKDVLKIDDNIYNIRIFNCFGVNEEPQRMIKNSVLRYMNRCDIIIHKDKEMDFFYINDLIKIIRHLLVNEGCHLKQINASYRDKITLIEVAQEINKLDEHKVGIVVENIGMANSYSGSSENLDSLGIKFIGFKEALKEYYKDIKCVKKHSKK